MRITVALRMRNTKDLKELVHQQATPGSQYYGTVITPADFNASYAPSAAAVAAVQNYLTGAGLTGVAVEPNRLFVSATGTAAQIEAAFNTSLAKFKQKGHTVFVNTAPAQVPSALAASCSRCSGSTM
jgi:pseudomonalisin